MNTVLYSVHAPDLSLHGSDTECSEGELNRRIDEAARKVAEFRDKARLTRGYEQSKRFGASAVAWQSTLEARRQELRRRSRDTTSLV